MEGLRKASGKYFLGESDVQILCLEVRRMREDFPYFRGNDGVYFDNASTTQKPEKVITAVESYLSEASNVGRGSYSLANKTGKKVEESRVKIADFIGADKKEIVFTSGATESLNMIPELISEDINDGQKILVSEEAHKSTRRPWMKLKETLAKQGKEITIKEYSVLETGDPDIDEIIEKADESTYLISVTHIHNAYGGKAEVKRLIEGLEYRPLISLDACQSIAHVPIDVKEMEIDFLSFSGHKMFASTGTGGLYINEEIHEKIGDYQVGGGYTGDIPERLETGTPNVSGILSMKAAIEYIEEIGIEKIRERNLELTQYLIERLEGKVKFEKGPYYANCEDIGYGIISFSIENLPAKDIGFILDSSGIYVRDGKHCREKGKNSVRISLQAYNTEEEIDKLIESIGNISGF